MLNYTRTIKHVNVCYNNNNMSVIKRLSLKKNNNNDNIRYFALSSLCSDLN